MAGTPSELVEEHVDAVNSMTKAAHFTRRNFLRMLVYSTPVVCAADAFWIEPSSLVVTRHSLSVDPILRLVHFSDIHYRGNRSFLEKVVERINSLSPDFVCFTGDIVEEPAHLDEALDILSAIRQPLYGVPGNHEYWSGVSFQDIAACFRATGGDWLLDRGRVAADGRCWIEGTAAQKQSEKPREFQPDTSSTRRILLSHYPSTANELAGAKYDAILAGHSHGGQVRLPFIGPLIVPYGVGEYDAGLYSTPAGPLHVSVGIGTFFLPVRFLCRPELAVIEM